MLRTNHFLSGDGDADALAEAIAVLDGAERDLRVLVPDPQGEVDSKNLSAVIKLGRTVRDTREALLNLIGQTSPWSDLAIDKFALAEIQRQIQEQEEST